ncbi:MAG: Type 1 glutamine amidotransferase-like domain-containing protein [Patescibacteria group bacterium]
MPTAANVEEGGKEWLIDDLYNCKKLGFKQIDICDIAAVSKQIISKRLHEANVIAVGGGDPFYLLRWIKKVGLNKDFQEYLKDKIYVGLSAGSVIMGDSLFLATDSLLNYEKTGKLNFTKGLGFVNLIVRPHLNSIFRTKITVDYLSNFVKKTKSPVYAIDDQSAVKVDGDKIEVVSEGTWKKFN